MSIKTNVSQAASDWWATSVVEIQPGVIRPRSHAIEALIGSASFSEMIWLMLRGTLPSPDEAALLEAALVASVDHGPHAPSIAIARMAATCGVGVNNAMASGINALGDVHGGAGQQCLELYDAIIARGGDLGMAALAVVSEAVAQKRLIPGFGHRFHPVDPRSGPLLALVRERVGSGKVGRAYLEAAEGVEAALRQIKGRSIPLNIDGATAVIFGTLGFSGEAARGLFILSRSVGILAHTLEQREQGGRIKGPMPPTIPYTYHSAEGPRDAGASNK